MPEPWEHNGVEITFGSDDAKFYAYVPDGTYKHELVAISLAEMKKKITVALKTAVKKGVKIFVKDGHHNPEFNEFEITALSSDGQGSVWGKTQNGDRRKVDAFNSYKYDFEKINKLKKLWAQRIKLEHDIEALDSSLKISPEEFRSLLGVGKQ